MKFHLKHPLPSDVETAWSTIMSEEFLIASYDHIGTLREKISEQEKDGKILTSLKITLQNELPTVAAKVIGSTKLSWLQDQIIDHSTRIMQWRIKIPGSNKITAKGSFSIIADGENSIRIVEGEVNVGIPIVGRKIEKHVCTQLENSYQKTAEFSQQWLQKHNS
jgi:hypothetical protein